MTASRARRESLAAALAALAALGLAGVAQSRLERGLAYGWPLFAVAAALAVSAMRGRRDHWPGQRPMRLAVPRWPWLLACAPGGACLVYAATLMGQVEETCIPFSWWWTGVAWLLAVGVVHAMVTGRGRSARPADEWPRLAVAGAVAVLLIVALVMRLAAGVDALPAFVEADEVYLAGQAGFLLHEDPCSWFSLYWVGIPRFSLVSIRVIELIFGDGLANVRLHGVAVGTLSVLATFAAGRRLIGNWPAFIAALLLAGAHTHVHWSRTVQLYIQTPAAAAILIWALVRVWTGGGLLSWVATALALALGTMTYQASQIFPLLVLLTVVGWGVSLRPGWWAWVASTAFVLGLATLLLGPLAREMWRQADLVAGRPSTVFLFSEQNLALMGEDRVGALVAHALRTAQLFNDGEDPSANYGAPRPIVDPVTGALVPLTAALLLARLSAPAAWMGLLWSSAYLVFAVFLSATFPIYHRVATVLVFVALAVGASLVELWAVIRDGLRLPRWTVPAASLAVALVAVLANADFYFRQFPLVRGVEHTLGLARLICAYGRTHTVLDATAVDGFEWVPIGNPARDIECIDIKPTLVPHATDIWKIDQMTQADDVVLIVPSNVLAEHPGQPQGYRIVRQYVDDTIRHPLRLPLTVFELRRNGS